MADNPKDLNTLLRAAFDAGTRFGGGYPEVDSWPPEEADVQYRAWLDDWHGYTWGPVQWARARSYAHERCSMGTLYTDHGGRCTPNCDYPEVTS